MLNKKRKKWRDLTQVRPSQYPFGYVRFKDMRFTFEELATPPYPVRPEDAATSAPVVIFAASTRWPIDQLMLSGDLVGGTLAQTFFPVEYLYLQEGQADSTYFEALSLAGDLVGGQLGQSFLPVEYHYLDEGQMLSEYFEALSISGDMTGGDLTGGTPLSYLNWPIEALALSGDLIGGTLAAA